MQHKVPCLICDVKPRRGGSLYCNNCNQQIESERKAIKKPKPDKYITYRDAVVGLYPNGPGTFRPQLLRISVKRLPKSKTIDLNQWCEGYSRDQVKAFKRCVQTMNRVS